MFSRRPRGALSNKINQGVIGGISGDPGLPRLVSWPITRGGRAGCGTRGGHARRGRRLDGLLARSRLLPGREVRWRGRLSSRRARHRRLRRMTGRPCGRCGQAGSKWSRKLLLTHRSGRSKVVSQVPVSARLHFRIPRFSDFPLCRRRNPHPELHCGCRWGSRASGGRFGIQFGRQRHTTGPFPGRNRLLDLVGGVGVSRGPRRPEKICQVLSLSSSGSTYTGKLPGKVSTGHESSVDGTHLGRLGRLRRESIM